MPQSYKREKPSGKFDALIIGSGMSGMALAAMLSKEGKRCLILERHYTPGGFTHVFKRRDYEWDVGIHYIGEVHRPKSMLRKIFDHISDKQLAWADMGDVYDRIVFGDRSYDFMKGVEPFREKMKSHFPSAADKNAIDKYIALIREASSSAQGLFTTRAMPGLVRTIAGPFLSRKSRQFSEKTTWQVLSDITANKELIGLLTAQFGDYGLPPKQSSFLMHAMVAKHYLNGAAFPVGGSSRIFETIEPVINAAGGQVFVSAEVERILVKHGRAFGVRMTDGTEITAPLVVSSAGVHITYDQLLAGEHSAKGTAEKLAKIPPSAAHLCLYLGLKESPQALGLPKANYWIYPDNPDHDENITAYVKDPDHAPLPMLYASFPAAKDPDFQNRYPGKSTIELITLGDYNRFEQWEKESWKKRGADYESLKENMMERMLDRFFEIMPALKGKIDHQELSTPLSTKHFVNYAHGEIYGLTHTPQRFSNHALSVHTPVKGLYLTGQDIVSCGIGGALSAAMITATVLLRKNMFRSLTTD